MIPFQPVGIFACLLVAGWSVNRLRRGERPRWLSLLGAVVGASGAAAIFDPALATRLARTVGIGRGADLLIYIVALAFVGSWFYFYQKVRTLSNAVTALVRELAIRDPRPASSAAAGNPAARDPREPAPPEP